jgi:hypothetical protein
MSRQPRFEDFSDPTRILFAYEIHRADIIKKDKMFFLEFWDIDRIARAGRLHEIFNKVMFCVGGYDDDPRTLFAIPEVRLFLREIAHDWPYFFYADNLETEFLIRLLICMTPNLTVMESDKTANYTAKINTEEANQAYKVLLDGFARVCSMDKEMNQDKFDARIENVKKLLLKEKL